LDENAAITDAPIARRCDGLTSQ